jgi:hypothetical protein
VSLPGATFDPWYVVMLSMAVMRVGVSNPDYMYVVYIIYDSAHSEMVLGPAPGNFVFLPKHRANSYN